MAITVPDNLLTTLGKLLVIILLFLAQIVAQLFGLQGAVEAIQDALEETLQDP